MYTLILPGQNGQVTFFWSAALSLAVSQASKTDQCILITNLQGGSITVMQSYEKTVTAVADFLYSQD